MQMAPTPRRRLFLLLFFFPLRFSCRPRMFVCVCAHSSLSLLDGDERVALPSTRKTAAGTACHFIFEVLSKMSGSHARKRARAARVPLSTASHNAPRLPPRPQRLFKIFLANLKQNCNVGSFGFPSKPNLQTCHLRDARKEVSWKALLPHSSCSQSVMRGTTKCINTSRSTVFELAPMSLPHTSGRNSAVRCTLLVPRSKSRKVRYTEELLVFLSICRSRGKTKS